ncbi:uncharacterized protein MYCFIDRAFT_208044 [Pseudocercospora fijiensis CIRAD86]|uniref:Uncharacterized protein n=1 Tax=Pseudocercospora fijiensis (strain CIRAD86) TaxID=383855 RepID=M2ZT24_PSEFD|nr:uncharacterized protein MYCFIDRAFT_208044 [Pseudocercospora fijiensis CIRAD86]EME82164.1 hypothetical protein MYCFIDRAFT_208044 [Pseudocercospora fijiensis CIRAD86]
MRNLMRKYFSGRCQIQFSRRRLEMRASCPTDDTLLGAHCPDLAVPIPKRGVTTSRKAMVYVRRSGGRRAEGVGSLLSQRNPVNPNVPGSCTFVFPMKEDAIRLRYRNKAENLSADVWNGDESRAVRNRGISVLGGVTWSKSAKLCMEVRVPASGSSRSATSDNTLVHIFTEAHRTLPKYHGRQPRVRRTLTFSAFGVS